MTLLRCKQPFSLQQRGSYVTAYQKHRLIQFIENHYSALYERSSIPDDVNKEKLWKLLTLQLNSKGPKKDESGWRRCFITYKAATRLKLKNIQDGKVSVENLNLTNLRIAKMCQMDTYGIDLNLLLSQAESSACAMTSAASLNISLINKNNSMPIHVAHVETIDSSNCIVEPNGSTSAENPINQIDDMCTEQDVFVQRDNTTNFSSATQHQNLNIGDIVTIIPKATVTTLSQHHVKQDRSHATDAQKDKLVQLVEENYSALFGRISNTVNADLLKAKLWQQIMLNLNSIGPKKTVPSWKRCLSSIKDITKKKLTVARNLTKSKVHGNLSAKFSVREQKLINMFGIDILDGCGQLEEIGCNLASNVQSKRNPSTKPESGSFESDPNFIIQPISVCTNSTVTSAMITGSNVEKTLTPDPQIRAHDIHSTYMSQPKSNSKKSTVTSGMLSEALSTVQKKLEMPVALENKSTAQNHPRTSCKRPVQSTSSRIRTFQTIQEATESTSNDFNEPDNETEQEPQSRELEIGCNLSGPPTKKNVHDRQLVDEQRVQLLDGNLLTIRPLQEQRPQRRGVEIHPNRFVRPHLSSSDSDSDNDEEANRRRFRLSKPLGVMAEESLELQKQNNALLSELLKEMRKPK